MFFEFFRFSLLIAFLLSNKSRRGLAGFKKASSLTLIFLQPSILHFSDMVREFWWAILTKVADF